LYILNVYIEQAVTSYKQLQLLKQSIQ